MSSFGRRLRRAGARAPHRTNEAFSGTRLDLLRAARSLTKQTPNAFARAEDSILCSIDLRDDVGAAFAYIAFRLSFDADARASVQADDFADGFEPWRRTLMYGPDGAANERPYVAIWAPRCDATLDMLGTCGFGVPPDWPGMVAHPPPDGEFLVFVKHDGRGALMHIDLEHVPALGGPIVAFSSAEPGAPVS
jgi:hypothetical protein